MNAEIAITLAVLVGVIFSLGFLRTAPDLILLGGLVLLLVAGIVEPEKAFSGFAQEGLIAVAALFPVAEGLRQTGALTMIGRQLLGQPTSLPVAQARLMFPVAISSAFMNNTPVVQMMLPIVSDWGRKIRFSASHLLLPLSYAAVLGGLCTLIGTSTTIVVNVLLRAERDGQGLTMFEIGWVGVPAAFVGLLYIVFFARWLLPDRKPPFTPVDDPREYTVEMLVQPGSPLVGRTIEAAGLRHLPGMYLMEIDREGHVLPAVASSERLMANDRLVFVGIVESIVDLQRIPGLKPATDQIFKLDSPRSERRLIEAVVSNSCPVLRMTIRDAQFRSRYNAAVIAVARGGQRIRKKIGDIELLAGDTLLMEAHPSFIELHRNSRDFYLVSEVQDSTPPRHERAWLAQLILAGMVVVVTMQWLSMVQAALSAACLMLLTGCLSAAEAKQSIDLSVLLSIGAGLGIGKAVETSGTAEVLGSNLYSLINGLPFQDDTVRAMLGLAIVYVVTMILTNIITAKAAAVLVFPIAMASARSLGVDIMPFAIAVMIAAAASFATPIGYQTNLMVQSAGGYRNSDYLRIGVPLSILVGIITLSIAPFVWEFHPQ